jgi:hypothetical protein
MLKLVWRRHWYRKELVPTAGPGKQFDQAVVEFVRTLPAYAIGCTQSSSVVHLTSVRDDRSQCARRRFVEPCTMFSDPRFGLRQGIARLFDFHFGCSEGRFDARSLLHQVAKWSDDAGRQDESCRILLRAVIDAGQYAPDKPLAENVAWNRVRKILKRMRVMFLHYDDVHNVLQQKDANPKELKKIQATFRNLMISRTWPVQLVLSGTEETLDIFKNDRQLKRRLKYVTFDDLVAADDAEWVGDAVKDFAKQAGLKYVEKSGSMLFERLIHAAAYQFGLVFELLLEAIEVALLAKRRTFGIDDFIEAYADRTAQPDELNIFESPGWQVIDPSIIFDKENQEKEPKTKKRGKKSEVRFDR